MHAPTRRALTRDHVRMTATHTRTHVYTAFANPHLTCAQCGLLVPRWHNPDTCGCTGPHWNAPCGHTAEVVSNCPSWSPVDGCTCPPPPFTP